MIRHISIQNYALIESLSIDFKAGFSVITGETGAGKSILLGALSLILGNRADTSILKDREKKCVVEAHFDIQRYSLKLFYDQNDIDYDEITVIRREINPQGRSRAFINDTPVNLNVIKDLSLQLTDIHSQHNNLNLNNHIFQLNVLDAYAKITAETEEFKHLYDKYLKLNREYKKLSEAAEKEKADYDYFQFRFNELEEAKLETGEQNDIEEELKQLNHTEEIKLNLSAAFLLLADEESGILSKMRDSLSALRSISSYYGRSEEFLNRLESSKIELDDLASELEVNSEDIEFNPDRAQILKERIDSIYELQNKHNVSSVEELIILKDELQLKLNNISSFDSRLSDLRIAVENISEELDQKAEKLSIKRKEAAKDLEKQIVVLLQKLAMPNAQFIVSQVINERLNEFGKDTINFLFSGNKHVTPKDISVIASGGEISRLMLSIKSVISDAMALPAIIFDEIDTGVSGEIAEKIGQIMKTMSDNMQVISITHLPQVAAKADHHYKVYKDEGEFDTKTDIKHLNGEDRIKEIASMLSGENITEAALQNARDLLK